MKYIDDLVQHTTSQSPYTLLGQIVFDHEWWQTTYCVIVQH